MKLYNPITVDLYNPYPLPRMNAQQHNVGRGALITLTANGQVITPNNETVRIFAKRPDGNVSYLHCTITGDGKVQADFTDQMLAAEGSVQVELELATKETNITTPIFIVEVGKSNVKDGVKSTNEYKALEKYTSEAKTHKEDAEKSANSAREAMQKAQEIKDSIPEDYTELSEKVEEVYKANSILCKTSGTTILTTDSAKVKPSIKTFGKSTQRQYEGWQLLNIDNMEDFAYGEFVTVNKDGEYINLESSLSDSSVSLEYPIPCEIASGTTVYLYVPEGDTTDITFALLDADKNVVSDLYIGTPCTLSSDVAFFKFSCSEDISTKLKIMLSDKENAEWEPFVGNAPSPSLEYKQEVTPIGASGSITHELLTSNILKPKIAINNTGLNIAINDKGEFVVSGTTKKEVASCDLYLHGSWNGVTAKDWGKRGEVTFCCDDETVFIFITHHDGTMTSLVENGKTSCNMAITDDNYVTGISFRFLQNTTYNKTIRFWAYYGTEKRDYEPYSEQPLTLQTPNGLHGIPLGQTIPDAIKNSPIHMSGVYWDTVEQQYYIGDTRNENGKDVQRVWKGEISYKPSFTETPDLQGRFIANSSISIQRPLFMSALCPALSNFAIWSTWGIPREGKDVFCLNSRTLYFSPSKTMAVDEVNEYFNGMIGSESPLIVSGILADPIITDTTEEEQTQYNAVHMNYPNTTIVNDAGAHMEVEYVCDTKEHIKQNYTPNSVTQDILTRLSALESNAVNS